MKACQFCAEEIQDKAIRCIYCGKDQENFFQAFGSFIGALGSVVGGIGFLLILIWAFLKFFPLVVNL